MPGPSDPQHRHDEFHRGQVPQGQLGSNSPVDGYVLTATSSSGDDFADWEASGAGVGGSMTVEETDGSPAEGSVTIIRVAKYTDNGTGDVTLFPGIINNGDGKIDLGADYIAILDPTEENQLSISDVLAYLNGSHAPGALAGAGIQLQVGTGFLGLFISQKDSTTVQLYPDQHDNHGIELVDRGAAGLWSHVDGSSVERNLGTMEARKGASASATITSGNTSLVVTHGAGYTPVAQDICIHPINNPTNDPGWWWVDTITSTQFTINVRANPGASGAIFAWRVDR